MIAFRCRCTHLLDAPASWVGHRARCPACGAELTVPEASDPLARAALDDDDRARRLARSARLQASGRRLAETTERPAQAPRAERPRAMPGAPPTRSLAAPAAPAPTAPAAPRTRAPTTEPRSPSRRFIVASTLAIAALVGGAVAWKLSRAPAAAPKAGATARSADSGTPSGPPREASYTDRLVAAIDEYYRGGESLRAAEALAPLARRADEATGNPSFRARTLNGAAWFLATTPHAKLRDAEAAIRLATLSVALSKRDANYLDTLAEALFLGGRATEAIDVEVEALAKLPKSAPYRAEFDQRLAKYRAAAGPGDAGPG